MALFSVDANKLDTFHFQYLQPDEAFLRKVRHATDQICEFLKARCFQVEPTDPLQVLKTLQARRFRDAKVVKIVQGGSLGKGTSLKRDSDSDLLLFLTIFKSHTDQSRFRKIIMQEVQRQLIQCQEGLNLDFKFLENKGTNPWSLSFQLCSKDSVDYIDFNVLPAYDALGEYNGSRPDPEVYTSLIQTRTYGQFSPCFTELQKDFIVDRPPKLKSLIRLVKHWYKELPEKKSLPPKYALELLAVYAWENGSGQKKFDMAEGFRTVLWLVERHEELCIFWTKYYDFENETIKQYLHHQLQKPRPVILDPADPTGNVGEGKDWDLLAEQATFYANQRCCLKPDGTRVQPWNVPVRAMDFYSFYAPELDTFCDTFLQPDKKSLQKEPSTIHKISEFLKWPFSQDAPLGSPKELKSIQGGSLGKGTSLKGGSDADLVLFLKSYTNQEESRKTIIEKVERQLTECRDERNLDFIFPASRWMNPRVLSSQMHSKDYGDYIDFNVLPAFDPLGQYNSSRPDPEVSTSLIKTGMYGDFSPCVSKLPKDFIVDRPRKLKRLIRLVECWYKELPEKNSLPPKYALELLAVYAWENGSGQKKFDMAEGFRTVLWLIERHEELCIFWTKYYDFENETIKQCLYKQLQKCRPVILDPVDPTGHVGEGKNWDLLAKQAMIYASQKCYVKSDGSRVQPWNVPVQAMDLHFVYAPELDTFHFQYLQPDKEFLWKVHDAIRQICEFLKVRCFQGEQPDSPKVLKIVKGGSLGKGTSLKQDSDADLVLFLNIFKSYTDQTICRKSIINKVKSRLIQCRHELDLDFKFLKPKRVNPRSLSFQMRSKDSVDYIDFDVLPAYGALGQYNGSRPDPEVYISLIKTGTNGDFSPCFTELQRDFIICRPTKLKNLIRLVKYWYKKLPEKNLLPPKYALELLAVYAWENGSGQDKFDMAEGFRTVLWLIERHGELCIFWTKYYDFETETIKKYLYHQLQKPRPVILDPADPTGNVSDGKSWDLLVEQATFYASQRCCMKLDGSCVQPWNVPFQVMPLIFINANKLDKFHGDFLQPSKEFLWKVHHTIDQICEFLKARCFQDAPRVFYKVLKIVKGGSLGKGTSLKRDSDADLVMFLNIFISYTDQEESRKTILEEVKRQLIQYQHELSMNFKFLKPKRMNPYALSFQLRSKDSVDYIDFNVLPAYDALGQYNGSRPGHEVNTSLIETWLYGEFSPCVTELQRDFIVDRPMKLKSLIRLVKYWYKELPEKESLPPKYALELLAVYAWENGSGQDKFDMAEGFRTVLWLIERHEEICMFWTKYYSFENETIKQCLYKQLQKRRPVILDPADPTENVGEGKNWDLLAKHATFYASQRCCVKPDGSRVQPWNVPFQVMPLLFIDANKLDKFHADFLQPSKEFLWKVHHTIDQICEFLKARCFQDAPRVFPKVLKIVKRGSLGKGTSLKQDSDADLVLLLTVFKSYTGQAICRKSNIQEIKSRLIQYRHDRDLDFKFLENKGTNSQALSFQLYSSDSVDYIDFNVLLAYDALGQYNGSRPGHEVNTSLIETWLYGEFSPCVTELQRDFIVDRPMKLKSLIRLVKYWYKELPEKESLPPKYALELLAVYAWENGSGQNKFDMAEGFRTVLWLIERHEEICMFWTKYYSFENETIKQCLYKQLQKRRPVILDPADPTGNVGEGRNWGLLAKHATFYASQRCCVKPDGSRVQPWNVPFQVMPLLFIDANMLDKFHTDFLQPSEEFLWKVHHTIDQICELLKARCFQWAPWIFPEVLKIVKGGSLVKGTSLKRDSDSDLLLFLTIFKSHTDQSRFRKSIIQEIERQFIQCQEGLNLDFTFLENKGTNPWVLSFQLRSKDSVDYIDFNVLPAYDALGQYNGSRPGHEVNTSLIKTWLYGEFSACVTELQRDFIVDRPMKLKSLIRLVKYWYKELPEKKSLPPKYALELLAVYAWENKSGQDKFDMAEGFRTVLWLIERHEELCIFWTKYYDFENETIKQCLHNQLRKPRPVILDPADPMANVGEGKNWGLLAKHATFYASQRCCLKPDGSRVQPWNMPLEVPWEKERSCAIL